MPRLIYTLLLYLLLPWLPLRLWLRGRKLPGYRRHWAERFGAAPRLAGPVIWLHCVSVGETRAAQPLVLALQQQYPQATLLLTHMTPTGRDAGVALFGDQVQRCYLPYDYPWAVRRFLRRVRPQLGILLETELWFNLVAECQRAGVPLALLNARMSSRSAASYARFAALTRPAWSALRLVAAQSTDDATRLEQLGAKNVVVMGNSKFDLTPPPPLLHLGAGWRAAWQRPVLLAASTRDGEEALILDAVIAAAIPHLLLLLVPRHPERWDRVASLVQQRGLRLQRRSVAADAAAVDVLLGDSMGEMYAYYAAADVALIGGSLLPLGGQNLIEACAVGCPVVVGPHMFNFSEATRQAVAAGAARQVEVAALAATLTELFGDAAARQAMSDAASRFILQHRGATQRALKLLQRFPLQGR